MFEQQPKRHPVQTFYFWFLILVSSVGLLGWKFDLFSPSQRESFAVLDKEQLVPNPTKRDPVIERRHELIASTVDAEDAVAETVAPLPRRSEEPLVVEPLVQTAEVTPPLDMTRESFGPGLESPDRTSMRVELASNEVAEVIAEGLRSIDEMESPSDFPSVTETVPASANESHRALLSGGRSEATPQTPVETSPQDDVNLATAEQLIATGNDVAALRLLSTWYWKHPHRRSELMTVLTPLAGRVYFQPEPHYQSPKVIEFGDRLETIAKEYKVSWKYLAKLNGADPKKVRPGQKLKVIEGPFSVVVDQSDYRLTVHAHGYFVASFPIGVGAEGRTPVGTFQVKNKLADPTYYGPEGTIAHDDPSNPLGEYWIEINDPERSLRGIGIHGTIEPDSIGTSSSQGCVRLRDGDIADLFDLLTVGSEVVIRP